MSKPFSIECHDEQNFSEKNSETKADKLWFDSHNSIKKYFLTNVLFTQF